MPQSNGHSGFSGGCHASWCKMSWYDLNSSTPKSVLMETKTSLFKGYKHKNIPNMMKR